MTAWIKGIARAILAAVTALCLTGLLSATAVADTVRATPEAVQQGWYRLILELVRHTATYSPPVASRTFAYVGVAGYEAVASGDERMISLAGQLNGLTAPPARDAALAYDDAVVLQATLAAMVKGFFANTGPSGQRAMAAMEKSLRESAANGLAPDVTARSEAYGAAVAAHVLAWSLDDGGAVIENMGFPYEYSLTVGPEHWVPTSAVRQQQTPLLPGWGKVRPFAMPDGASCPLPPPPAYSEEPGSAFHAEAMDVYEVVRDLTPDQKLIARFWSDDPMLTQTPPGHWISIAMAVMEEDDAGITQRVDVMARLGVTLADAFIGCWHAKFEYDLLRPITYIRRVIDPKWEPLLNTPPFPEYPSGHSTQSAAAAEVLTAAFGGDHAFVDPTHSDENMPERAFASFRAAADEAALSRLYGGIHFRTAIERGLAQGRCIGAYAVALRTRR